MGKKGDWDGWSEKFLAKAECKGYRKLLLCEKNENLVDKVQTHDVVEAIRAKSSKTDDEKKILKISKLNREAYMDLVLSVNSNTSQGKIAFRLAKNCKTKVYPEGNCKLVWDRLTTKYEPKTTSALLKLKKKFENSKLEREEDDPEDWITELEGHLAEIEIIDENSAISEKDLMVHILNNLPMEYDSVSDSLETQLDKTGSEKLTLELIREKLARQHERIEKNIKETDKREHRNEEKALANFPKQFKGLCYNCGKYGHKGADCPDKKTQTQYKKGECWFCGNIGHTMFKCEKFLEAQKGAKIERANLAIVGENESFDELGL